MDCKQIREVLDLYIDKELSTEAMAAAGKHLSDCVSCRRVEAELVELRHRLKAAVNQYQIPPHLELRVRSLSSRSRRRHLILAFASISAFLLIATLVQVPIIDDFAANLFERFAFHLGTPRVVVIEGRLICRDCELKRMYGAKVHSDRAALETSDGKIWNLMEDDTTEALIHNGALLGKTIRVKGKIYRRAGCVEVESYQLL